MKLRIVLCLLALACACVACVDSGYGNDPIIAGAVANAQVQATESARREREQLARLAVQATGNALQVEQTQVGLAIQGTQAAQTATVGAGYAASTATVNAATAIGAAATAGAVAIIATQASDSKQAAYMQTERARYTQAVLSVTETARAQEWAETTHSAATMGLWLVVLAGIAGTGIALYQWNALLSAKRRLIVQRGLLEAERLRLMDTTSGPVYIGPGGAQQVADRWSAPQINDWRSTQAGYADSAERLETPKDPDRELAIKLILDSIAVEGEDGNSVPRWETLKDHSGGREWKSTHQRDRAVAWLIEQSAVTVRPNEGTFVTHEYQTLGGVLRALSGAAPSPTVASVEF